MEKNHGEDNARRWSETMSGLVVALEADFDTIEDLRNDREALVDAMEDANAGTLEERTEAAKALADWDEENGEALAELVRAAIVDGEEFKEREHVEQRIQEAPLSVQVRSGWVDPGGDMQAEEFQVLLTTGGPALRIRGELDRGQPTRAWLEYQDWGTPWIQYFQEQDTLLAFCSVLYFGE